jgi:chaperonin GroES
MEVSVGQRILFAKYAGTEVKVGDEEYLILRESDIMGIVE